MYCLVNGRLQSTDEPGLSMLDRGFTLGDGVFETMLAIGQQVFRLSDHLARLREGLRVLSISLSHDDAALASAVDQVLRANALPRAILRLTISRGPAQRGLLPLELVEPTIVLQVSQYHAPPDRLTGYRAVVASIRRNESSPLSRIKSCNYLDNVLARMEAAAAGADEAVLVNQAGEVACCTAANIHVVFDGRIWTPPVACGTLPGIARKVVSELASELAMAWEERAFGVAAVSTADEAFITSSVLGVAPLVALDGSAIGSGLPGEVTQQLAENYDRRLAKELSLR